MKQAMEQFTAELKNTGIGTQRQTPDFTTARVGWPARIEAA
jgi:hypothetical protein